MSDMAEVFNEMRQRDKERRHKNLKVADTSGFTKHTDYHYSTMLLGQKLDYWPSKNKWRWCGRNYHGNVRGFIRKASDAVGLKSPID